MNWIHHLKFERKVSYLKIKTKLYYDHPSLIVCGGFHHPEVCVHKLLYQFLPWYPTSVLRTNTYSSQQKLVFPIFYCPYLCTQVLNLKYTCYSMIKEKMTLRWSQIFFIKNNKIPPKPHQKTQHLLQSRINNSWRQADKASPIHIFLQKRYPKATLHDHLDSLSQHFLPIEPSCCLSSHSPTPTYENI